MLFCEQRDDLSHLLLWIHLAGMGSEGCDADPAFIRLFYTYYIREVPEVAAFLWEDTLEIRFDRIAQLSEHIRIVVEGGRLLCEHLVLFPAQLSFPFLVFVDMCHRIAAKKEAQAEVTCAENIVEVGHGSGLLGNQTAV